MPYNANSKALVYNTRQCKTSCAEHVRLCKPKEQYDARIQTTLYRIYG